MSFIETLTDYLIKRRLKNQHIPIVPGSEDEPSLEFRRVLNTLRENKVMVVTQADGIYIRLAGTESKGESFSDTFVKAKSFSRTYDGIYSKYGTFENEKNEWKKISDEIPPHEPVLMALDTYDCGWIIDSGWWDVKNKCWMTSNSPSIETQLEYTHWRLWPEPPKS